MAKDKKTYYRIAEAAALLDIPDYTLRFWEDMIPMFKPDRSPGGARRYTPEHIELARRIKELLYDKGMKIEAAIAVLDQTYRKYPPHHIPLCKSPADALKLLKAVKVTLEDLEDAHAIARIKAVEGWIKRGGTV